MATWGRGGFEQGVHLSKYIPEIDGLRAVAVTAVVLNHAGLPQVAGGFFGVDIFFVISGYLISDLVFSEVKVANFSIISFYQRRCRRLVPALVVMILAIFPFAYLIFLWPELKDFAKTALTSISGLSNFYFYKHSGYFDTDAAMSPLLHTWSLSVEEQFYLFFPILILAVHRLLPHRMLPAYLAVFVISFVLCAYNTVNSPAAAFYLLPYRAWELALGALVSLPHFCPIRSDAVRNICSSIGVALMAIGIFLLSPKTPYLGLSAAIPCLGAALVIASGRSGGASLVARVLSTSVPLFIGKISYSLYLWHWPIIVFHRLGLLGTDQMIPLPALLIGGVGVSFLSWKYVEQPFRRSKNVRLAVAIPLAGLISVAAVAGITILTGGARFRFPEGINQLASYMYYDASVYTREGKCFGTTFDTFNKSECLAMDPNKKNILLIGDSHAAHLWHGLAQALPGINILQATGSSCLPLSTNAPDTPKNCRELTDFIFNDFIRNSPIDGIILNASWGGADRERIVTTLNLAKRTVNFVAVIGPTIQYDLSLPKLLAVSRLRGDPQFVIQHVSLDLSKTESELKIASAKSGVKYISQIDLLCQTRASCRTELNGVPLLYDRGHLTVEGSEYVGKLLRDAIEEWLSTPPLNIPSD